MVDKVYCKWYAGCHREASPDRKPTDARYCQFHHDVQEAYHKDDTNFLTLEGCEFVMSHGYANIYEVVSAANYLRQLQAEVANLPKPQPTDEVTNGKR